MDQMNIWRAAKENDYEWCKQYLAELISSSASSSSLLDEINEYNDEYQTPLMCAASYNNYGILGLLLAHKANVNLVDVESGYTALHRAAYHGYLLCCSLLIQAGADTSIRDYDGYSAIDLFHFYHNDQHDLSWYKTHIHQIQNKSRDYPCGSSKSIDDGHGYIAAKNSYAPNYTCHSHIYTCGSNLSHQLGLPDIDQYQSTLKAIPSLLNTDILHVSVCKHASAVISQANELYIWGRNVIGMGETVKSLHIPKQLVVYGASNTEEVKFRHVSLHDDLACSTTIDGGVYVWGLQSKDLHNHEANDVKVKDIDYYTPQLLATDLHVVRALCFDNRLILLTRKPDSESKQLKAFYVGRSVEDNTWHSEVQKFPLPAGISPVDILVSNDVVLILSSKGDVLQSAIDHQDGNKVKYIRVQFPTSSAIGTRITSRAPSHTSTSPIVSAISTSLNRFILDDRSASSKNNRYVVIERIAVCTEANRGVAIDSKGVCYDWKLYHNGSKHKNASAGSSKHPQPSSSPSSAPPMLSKAAGRRLFRIDARIVPGLANVQCVDVAVRRGQTCVVTRDGHIYTFGMDVLGFKRQSISAASASAASKSLQLHRMQRVQDLNQATRVYLADKHVMVTVATHRQRVHSKRERHGKRGSVSTSAAAVVIPSLRHLCQQHIAEHLQHKQVLNTYEWSLTHASYELAAYSADYITRNLAMLLNQTFNNLHPYSLYYLDRYYQMYRRDADAEEDDDGDGVLDIYRHDNEKDALFRDRVTELRGLATNVEASIQQLQQRHAETHLRSQSLAAVSGSPNSPPMKSPRSVSKRDKSITSASTSSSSPPIHSASIGQAQLAVNDESEKKVELMLCEDTIGESKLQEAIEPDVKAEASSSTSTSAAHPAPDTKLSSQSPWKLNNRFSTSFTTSCSSSASSAAAVTGRSLLSIQREQLQAESSFASKQPTNTIVKPVPQYMNGTRILKVRNIGVARSTNATKATPPTSITASPLTSAATTLSTSSVRSSPQSSTFRSSPPSASPSSCPPARYSLADFITNDPHTSKHHNHEKRQPQQHTSASAASMPPIKGWSIPTATKSSSSTVTSSLLDIQSDEVMQEHLLEQRGLTSTSLSSGGKIAWYRQSVQPIQSIADLMSTELIQSLATESETAQSKDESKGKQRPRQQVNERHHVNAIQNKQQHKQKHTDVNVSVHDPHPQQGVQKGKRYMATRPVPPGGVPHDSNDIYAVDNSNCSSMAHKANPLPAKQLWKKKEVST